tara:strand:- start:71 stop:535 length:465 start_codon:yes stop_codon:yes gene_type:complete
MFFYGLAVYFLHLGVLEHEVSDTIKCITTLGVSMSVFQKLQSSINECNLDGYLELLHPDFIFLRHQFSKELNKKDWTPIVSDMFKSMAEGKLSFEKARCIYENDKILVLHHIGIFPDNTREAILEVHTIYNGKIIKTETGATRIDRQKKSVSNS